MDYLFLAEAKVTIRSPCTTTFSYGYNEWSMFSTMEYLNEVS